jgi:hypothetical protein
MRKLALANDEALLARESLRKRYRPTHVRLLFVGEAPPASGRFFYQADSGLYRAIRDTFVIALPSLQDADFLASFRTLGCYLVDLCGRPVDDLDSLRRRKACVDGEPRLSKMIRQLQPKIVVTVVRSITANVTRAEQRANWRGLHVELPYPGRWCRHRDAFLKTLTPVLSGEFESEPILHRES